MITQKQRQHLVDSLISEWESMQVNFTRDELEDDCGNSGIDVRLQFLDDELQLHTGDSQYDTSHLGYWGEATLDYDWKKDELEANVTSLVNDLIEQVQREIVADNLWMERFSD